MRLVRSAGGKKHNSSFCLARGALEITILFFPFVVMYYYLVKRGEKVNLIYSRQAKQDSITLASVFSLRI